jgi:hypothetical protein
MSLLVVHYIYIPRRFSFRIQYSRQMCSWCNWLVSENSYMVSSFPQGHCWLVSVQMNFPTYFSNLRIF